MCAAPPLGDLDALVKMAGNCQESGEHEQRIGIVGILRDAASHLRQPFFEFPVRRRHLKAIDDAR